MEGSTLAMRLSSYIVPTNFDIGVTQKMLIDGTCGFVGFSGSSSESQGCLTGSRECGGGGCGRGTAAEAGRGSGGSCTDHVAGAPADGGAQEGGAREDLLGRGRGGGGIRTVRHERCLGIVVFVSYGPRDRSGRATIIVFPVQGLRKEASANRIKTQGGAQTCFSVAVLAAAADFCCFLAPMDMQAVVPDEKSGECRGRGEMSS